MLEKENWSIFEINNNYLATKYSVIGCCSSYCPTLIASKVFPRHEYFIYDHQPFRYSNNSIRRFFFSIFFIKSMEVGGILTYRLWIFLIIRFLAVECTKKISAELSSTGPNIASVGSPSMLLLMTCNYSRLIRTANMSATVTTARPTRICIGSW